MEGFGTRDLLGVFGHTLNLHNQTPEWDFKHAEGNDASPKILIDSTL